MAINIHRALRTLSAHLFGQVVTILGVIAIPWVCLGHWSAEEFGVWVIASAVAQFFLVADGGLSGALSNHLCLDQSMTSLKAKETIRHTFNIIVRRIVSSVGVAILVTGIAYALVTIRSPESSQYLVGGFAFLFIAISSAMQPLIGLFCAVMRYRGANGIGIVISNFTRFCELVALAVAVYFGANLFVAALVIASVKIFAVLILMKEALQLKDIDHEGCQRYASNYRSSSDLKRVGYGIASNYLALNLMLHGLVLVASLGGALAAAIFSTTRTVARLPGQPLGIAFLSIGPEITEIYKRKDLSAFRRMSLLMLTGTIIFTIFVGGLSIFLREWLERAWLHGKVSLPADLLFAMVIGMLAHVAWQSASQILSAINQTFKVGITYLVVACAALASAALAQATNGLLGIAVIWGLVELFMCIAVWRHLFRLITDRSHWING